MAEFIIVCAILICILLLRFATPKRKSKQQTYNRRLTNPAIEYFHWPHLNEFEFPVVGESHYQNELKKISESTKGATLKAYLIPDDLNPYDKKAIRVDIDNMTVGYLSRDDAPKFRRRLAQKKLRNEITTCDAIITGGHIKDDETMSLGCNLDMKPFN